MDLGIIIAIVGTGIAIVGVVLAMMFWTRSETNSLRADAKEDRKDLLELVYAIQLEMKDFHFKLIEIERTKQSNR